MESALLFLCVLMVPFWTLPKISVFLVLCPTVVPLPLVQVLLILFVLNVLLDMPLVMDLGLDLVPDLPLEFVNKSLFAPQDNSWMELKIDVYLVHCPPTVLLHLALA